jgi:hypothetical protein
MNRRLLALFFASVISLSAFFTATTASAAESVKLFTAFFGTQSRYGCTQHSGSFDILTTAFGYQKSVYVHLKEVDGSWVDLPASFIEALPDGREVWRASVLYGQGACPTAKLPPDTFELAIKVSTSSGDTWDNNGGANYQAAKASGSMLVVPQVASGGMSVYNQGDGSRAFYANAFLRNLGYSKNVDIVYSTDGWKTAKTAPLAYTNPYFLGYGSYASPNSNGIEVWVPPTITFADPCVDFAIRYRVNGTESWDNNFGRNYHLCAP